MAKTRKHPRKGGSKRSRSYKKRGGSIKHKQITEQKVVNAASSILTATAKNLQKGAENIQLSVNNMLKKKPTTIHLSNRV